MVWDRLGSEFDTRVLDIFTLPDREAIGGSIEIAGLLPPGVDTGIGPDAWTWPPKDLRWLDIGFAVHSAEPGSLTHAPLDKDDSAGWFVFRVENPLSLDYELDHWPFSQGAQGFTAHDPKCWKLRRKRRLRH
jgi:hypothetical protein